MVYEPSGCCSKRKVSGGVDQVLQVVHGTKSGTLGVVVRYIHTAEGVVQIKKCSGSVAGVLAVVGRTVELDRVVVSWFLGGKTDGVSVSSWEDCYFL